MPGLTTDRISQTADSASSASEHQQRLSQDSNTHPKQLKQSPITPLKPVSEQSLNAQALNEFGVTRSVSVDGLVQYKLPGSSDGRVVLEGKAGPNEFAQSMRALQKQVQTKEVALQSEYHVSFSIEGENAVRPMVQSTKNPNALVPGAMLHARAPRLSELGGIEAALQASAPSQLLYGKSDKGLKFYFLKTPSEGKDTYDAGVYAGDKNGRASVFFEPDAQPDAPITAADAVSMHQDIKTSFEALAAHEIAHNTELKLGLLNYTENYKQVTEQLGWAISPDSSYLLQKGKNGDFYRLTTNGLSSDNGWIRCDSNGAPLDKDGKPVSSDAAPHLTNAQVRERALVRPATDYFTSPSEMLADSLMLYRIGASGRDQLSKSGNQLYLLVKKVDQDEINSQYGTTADGSPKKVRLPDGHLVDNSADSQQIVANYEKTLRMS